VAAAAAVAAAATAAAVVADAIAGKRTERTVEHEKRHSNVAFFFGAFSGAPRIAACRKSRSALRPQI
jgi:hypothetical protein